MSKKLIAVASAAALALTAFVAVPSMAAAGDYSVTVTTKIAGTGADATTNAITVNVPTGDVIRASATTTDTTALTITVATTTATGSVTASSTGGIKLLTAAELAASTTTSKSGAQTLSMAAASNSAVFYAFTTSTTGGTLTVSNGGNTTTLYVKGVSANGYNLTISGPSIASKGVAYSFTAVVKDMFGNPTTGLLAANFVSTGLGAFAASPTETVTESTATPGTYTIKLAAADAAATGAGLLSVVLTTKIYTEVEAFGDLGSTATLAVNSTDPAVSIAALQTQVTALTGQVATLTSDYNKLATKYNKLVKKSKRVAKK
jgi:hypothetical protein